MTARVLHQIQNIKHGVIKKKDYYICWFLFNYPVIMTFTNNYCLNTCQKKLIYICQAIHPQCVFSIIRSSIYSA